MSEKKHPKGITCGECDHIERCEGLGYSWRGRDKCDFKPSRLSLNQIVLKLLEETKER